MKGYVLLAAVALVAAVGFTLPAADEGQNDPSAPPVPAPGEKPTTSANGQKSPSVPTPFTGRKRPGELPPREGKKRQPEPQAIDLSGRLHRPKKWYPQLELIPAGQIKRFDLQGQLLQGIKEGTFLRVRGVVRSSLHRGGTRDNPSSIPPQWIIYLEVTEVKVLDHPLDVLKQEPLDDTPLHQVEKSIRRALPDLAKELRFEYPKSSRSLVVYYRTRTFMVHPSLPKTGDYSEKAHEEVGPGHKGFRLKLHLQEAGTANQAAIPPRGTLRIREPYWMTDLGITQLAGTGKQLYWALSCGSQVDEDVLKRLRKTLKDLGESPQR
jgi:hypothetical protein